MKIDTHNVLQKPFQDIDCLGHYVWVVWTEQLRGQSCNQLNCLIFPLLPRKTWEKNDMPATSTVEVSIAAGANLSHWDGKRLIFGSNDTGSGENLPCPLQSPPTPTPTPPTKTTPSRPGQRPPCQLPSLLPELLLISLNHHCQPPRAQNWFFKGLNIHTIRNWEKFL